MTIDGEVEQFATDFKIDRQKYPRIKVGKNTISFRAEHNANGSGGWSEGEPALSVPKWIVERYAEAITQEANKARLDELKALQTKWYQYANGKMSPKPNPNEDWLGADIYDRIAQLTADKE